MRSRFLFAATAAALLTLAGCADSATAPRRFDPGTLRTDVSPGPDGTCRGGYHLIARSDGTQACEAD
jgi:hypothetical protein